MRMRTSVLPMLIAAACIMAAAPRLFAGETAPDADALPFGAVAKFKASDTPGETRGIFSHSGEQLAVGGANHVTVWNLQTGGTVLDFPDENMLGASVRLRWLYLS